MTSRFQFISLLFVCSSVFPGTGFATVAEVCEIGPGSRSAAVSIPCQGGDSTEVVDPGSATEVESDASFHLLFKKSLFNSKRVVTVKDRDSGEDVLQIDVTAPFQAAIQSLVDDRTWILDGLQSAKLSQLSIQAQGTVIIKDALEIDAKFTVDTNNFYLLKAFSILNGTFRLRYQEGFVSRLNFPFQTVTEGNYSVLESLSAVNSPSRRRVSLNQITNNTSNVLVSELEEAYQTAFHKPLGEDHPVYLLKTSDDERKQYIKQYIFAKLVDNVKKGIIGETIYRKYMARRFPQYEFKDPKVGLNSFDAIHIRRNTSVDGEPAVKRIFISEVKYAAKGKPVLGVIKVEDREWRQMSLPYVRNKLARMQGHSTSNRQISTEILTHSDKVKLRLAVFNPDTLELVIYHVGDMTQSVLD